MLFGIKFPFFNKKEKIKPIMEVSQNGVDLVKKFEGLFLHAYPDPATGNEPITIGWGTTIYPDGTKVKMGDIITQTSAEVFLRHDLNKVAKNIVSLITTTLNQNQIDSIISFTYNVGEGNLKKSTLLRKLNINPNDQTIRDEFMKWVKANSMVMKGLVRRRTAEADLYFTPINTI